MLCRDYDTPGIKELVAKNIGNVSKGDLVDYVDFYCGTVTPALSTAEQQQLLTELWNWREQYVAYSVWS